MPIRVHANQNEGCQSPDEKSHGSGHSILHVIYVLSRSLDQQVVRRARRGGCMGSPLSAGDNESWVGTVEEGKRSRTLTRGADCLLEGVWQIRKAL